MSPNLRFHWLKLRATCHATEDKELVAQALGHAAGLDTESLEGALQATAIESHHGAEVLLLEVDLSRARDIRAALEGLLGADDRARLLEEAESRTDDDGVFHFRIDKQAALAGDLVLTRGDDPIQVRLKPEVHPAGRERAVAALRAWLTDRD